MIDTDDESYDEFTARLKAEREALEQERAAAAVVSENLRLGKAGPAHEVIVALSGLAKKKSVNFSLDNKQMQVRLDSLLPAHMSAFERHAGVTRNRSKAYPPIVSALLRILREDETPGLAVYGISPSENAASIWKALQTRRKNVGVTVFPNAEAIATQ